MNEEKDNATTLKPTDCHTDQSQQGSGKGEAITTAC